VAVDLAFYILTDPITMETSKDSTASSEDLRYSSNRKNSEKRIMQNRAAQRAFRARKEAYILALENQVTNANIRVSELELQVETLKAQIQVYKSKGNCL
jgi:chromosome segregation ATPase